MLNYALDVDGEYGGRTRDAVRRFKARRDLAPDGVADAAMLSALDAAVSARRARRAKRDGVKRAAGPVAGAATLFGVTVSTVAEAAREVRGLEGTSVLIGGLCVAVVMVAAGAFVWRFALRRAEGPLGEDPE